MKLMPSITQADILAETSRQFTSAFNQAVQLGWDADVSNATKLHYLAYTRDIPRKPVAAVGILLATTAVPVVGLCVENVGLTCMPTSMRPVILRQSIMPALRDVMLVGCRSTNQSCPIFGLRRKPPGVSPCGKLTGYGILARCNA